MKPTTLRMDPALVWPGVARVPAVRRYAVFVLLVSVSVLGYTWSRVDSREMAVRAAELETAMDRLRIENERLALELASLENVAALEARAGHVGLVAHARVVEVR
ncbi:MAG: cell division protein FtsL [Deltaproteobacteria bacterium]|nr:cell division protein FtsL [Deltaproteobacteria bacterium]